MVRLIAKGYKKVTRRLQKQKHICNLPSLEVSSYRVTKFCPIFKEIVTFLYTSQYINFQYLMIKNQEVTKVTRFCA